MYDGSIIIESKVSYYFQAWNEEHRSFYSYDNTVSNEPEETINSLVLYRNYPNPFNPSTSIRYSLSKASNVSLKIYSSTGQEVATLVEAYQSKGDKTVEWNASHLASGIYYVQLRTNGLLKTIKMTLLK